MDISTAPNSAPAIAAIQTAQRYRHNGIALAYFVMLLSEHYLLEFDEVYSVLATFPENYLDFAQSPEGVSALGDAVAQTIYADACNLPPLMLTVH